MHELSIAVGLVEFADREAAKAGWKRISEVHLKIGPLSGVVPDALEFAFDVACRGSVLEGARLVIDNVPVVVYCDNCREMKQLQGPHNLSCPECGTLCPDVRQGREMEVTAFEVQTNGAPP